MLKLAPAQLFDFLRCQRAAENRDFIHQADIPDAEPDRALRHIPVEGFANRASHPCSLPFTYSCAVPFAPPRPLYVIATCVHCPCANGVRFTTTSRFRNTEFRSVGRFSGFQDLSAPKTPRRKWRGLSSFVKSAQMAESL